MTQLSLGQNMHVSWYSVTNGLPSNEVRYIARDSLGFVWIATDAGPVRFDGTRFEDFSQYVPSQYGRYFHPTDEGLLLSHDAGISLIQSGLDSTRISLFKKASIDPGDMELYYPGIFFERENGDLLVGQPGGQIHQLSSGVMNLLVARSGDPAKDAVDLHFGEVSGQLWVAHSDGSLYTFDDVSRSLKKMADFPLVNDMKFNGSELWIASDMIYRIQLTANGKQIVRRESFPTSPGEVTSIALDNQENIYLGIRNTGLYYLDRTPGKPPEFIEVFGNNDPHSINKLPFKNIHNIVIDTNNKLWICSSEGLGVLQKRFFESIGSIPNANTTAISIADNGKIFVNFGDIYKVERTDYGYTGEQLSTSSLGTITALTTHGNSLWTGTSTGKLFELNQQGQKVRTIDLEERGEGIFYLAGDRNDRLWVAQAPRDKPLVGIGCVLPNGTFKEYGPEKGLENRIICLKETKNGPIYASGIGIDSYLYRYYPQKDRFVNLSTPLDFYVGPNFQVHDFTVDEMGVIWLASTDGLLRYDMDRVTKIDLGPGYSNKELKAVAHAADGSIWVSFDTEGVLLYKDGQIIVMQEESGLPSKVMTYRCLESDKDGRLWIGSSEGMVYSYDANPMPGKSNMPWIISINVDEQSIKEENLRIDPDQEIDIEYIAPSFQGFRTFFQYQINNSEWSSSSSETTLNLKGLLPGSHTLALRAKKEGAFLWSEPRLINISVVEFWYKSKIFLWTLVLSLIFMIAFIFWSQKRRFKLILNSLNQGLEAKKDEVFRHEADLVKVREEMKLKQREKKANLLVLEIMLRLVSKIDPNTKWEIIMETISLDLAKLPGVVAFEIGVHRGKNIEFEGYSERVRGFTSAKVPFDPGSSLAAYCITNAKAFIFNRLSKDTVAFLEKKDPRIEGYKAAISVPFYIKNHEAIFTVYGNQEEIFDEYARKTFQIFAAYLEQIV